MADKLPTLSDLPSAASEPRPGYPARPDDLPQALPALAPLEPAAAEPQGYWVRILDKGTGRRSKVNCQRLHGMVDFKNGEAVVPAKATVAYEHGGPGKTQSYLLIDLLRGEFGYEIVPIPQGTPMMPSDDIAKYQDALA